MYINFKLLKEKNISIEELILIQMAKQQKFEDLGLFVREFENRFPQLISKLETQNLIYFVKATRGINESRIRITADADKLLSDIETPEVLEQDLVLFEWVKNIYKQRDKKIGNMKKTKLYIALFRTHSGISGNSLAYLIKTFLENEDAQKYSHIAEYIFFKPPSAYSTKFDLEESKLWKFYQTFKEQFDRSFEKLNKTKLNN